MWEPIPSRWEQATDLSRSNWSIRKRSTTGVGEVGEFVKMGVGTWEALCSLSVETLGVLRTQVFAAQGLRNGIKGGGVGRSSDEGG